MFFEKKDIAYLCICFLLLVVACILAGDKEECADDKTFVLPDVQVNCTAGIQTVEIIKNHTISECDLEGVAEFMEQNKHNAKSIESSIKKYRRD